MQPEYQVQESFAFDSVTLKKIGKGAIIAGLGAAAVYGLEAVMTMDFGEATPMIVALASILLNAVKEFVKGR